MIGYTGQRLSYAGALCTVHYVGPLEGTKGEWLGVEWDDPGRGKHSGTHQGVKYFDFKSRHPTAGSFIRLSRPADPSSSFLGALHKKYASEADDVLASRNFVKESAIEISGKVVEEVGFEKIRHQLANVHELRIILLDGFCVAGLNLEESSRDSPTWRQSIRRVHETCSKIIELDLSRNLIEQWADVIGICEALSVLKSLKLNGNRFRDLSPPSYDSASEKQTFQTVIELCLDDTLLTWDEISILSTHFPNLTHLSLSSNLLTTLSAPLALHSLTTLTLKFNSLTALAALRPLTNLTSLENLDLHSNSISTIALSSSQPLLFPPTLQTLDLSQNALATFTFISALATTFPGLTSLRSSNNPLYSTQSLEEGFMLTLARLPTLQTLNYSKISAPERQNAEIYYLSTIAKTLSSTPEEQSAAIITEHPRYHELCTLYGEPSIVRGSVGENNVVGENTLAARLIKFSFYMNPPIEQSSEGGPVEKSKLIPKTVNTYRLKYLVGRLFSLAPMHLRLIWETGERDPVGGRGDDDRWSVSSGEDRSAEEGEEGIEDVDAEKDEVLKVDANREEGKWIRREVELVDGTREVGFWIEGREARVRVEWRDKLW